MAYYNENGVVILWLLFIIQLLLLLAINTTHIFMVSNQVSLHHDWASDRHVQAYSALAKLESNLKMDRSTCLRTSVPSGSLTHLSTGWWRQHACQLSSANDQFYFIESLGSEESIAIESIEYNQCDIAMFYRITLHLGNESDIISPLILQSTLALAGGKRISCDDKLHIINSGRQSVRQLL